MCKAGFAGDDAPRAVFRESHPGILATIKLLLSGYSLLMLCIASIVGRPRHHGYGLNSPPLRAPDLAPAWDTKADLLSVS